MSLLTSVTLIWAAAIVLLLIVWKIIIVMSNRDRIRVIIDPSAFRETVNRAEQERTHKQSA